MGMISMLRVHGRSRGFCARGIAVLAGCLLGIAGMPASVNAIEDGIVPDAIDVRFDAVCAFSRTTWIDGNPLTGGGNTANTYGSGVLIAPDIVITAKHLLYLDGWRKDSLPPSGHYSVRFRRLTDGSVVLPPTTNPADYFDVQVVGVTWGDEEGYGGGASDAVLLHLASPVLHIEPMQVSSSAVSARNAPFSNQSDQSDAIYSGFIAGWGNVSEGGGGGIRRLRYQESQIRSYWNKDQNGARKHSHVNVVGARALLHDSGGAILSETESGEPVLISIFTTPETGVAFQYDRRFRTGFNLVQHPKLNRRWDVTGEAAGGGDSVGVPDGGLDLNDLVYAIAQIYAGNPDYYLSSSTASFDPANIHCPSLLGPPALTSPLVMNAWDAAAFWCGMTSLPNRYSPISASFIRVDTLDLDGDYRFTQRDVDWLEEMIGSDAPSMMTFDFNQNGIIDTEDVEIFQLAHDLAGHGVFGDVNGDGVADSADWAIIQAGLLDGTFSFDNVFAGSTEYRSELDADGDGDNDNHDWDQIRILFTGDVARTGTSDEFYPLYAHYYRPNSVVDWRDAAAAQYVAYRGWNYFFSNSYALTYWDRAVLDVTTTSDPEDPSYGVRDGYIDLHDLRVLLERQTGPDGMDVPQLMYPAIDPNGDGRFNYHDLAWYVDRVGTTDPEELKWSLNPGGITSGCATRVFLMLYGDLPAWTDVPPDATNKRYNHGVFGDWDESCQPACIGEMFGFYYYAYEACDDSGIDIEPDCADFAAVLAELANNNDIFDGRSFPDPAYAMRMDANLDGVNDEHDKIMFWRMLQPGDMNYDGVVDELDLDLYYIMKAAQHPLADINGDGVWDAIDDDLMVGYFLNPKCP